MSLSRLQRLRYLAWAARYSVGARDTNCPACGTQATTIIRRKYLVTSLWECASCRLRFRVPKDSKEKSSHFYQDTYAQGFTTDCPSDEVLSSLVARNFSGAEKDFGGYIDILRAVGLKDGDSILDFGCSWGYGSWQLSHAGFKVHSYEISKPRAAFARTKLGCNVLASLADLTERVDCFFSSHVIEHLPDPNVMWNAASVVLSARGVMVCFCPNGSPGLESTYGHTTYDRLWGKVHPLLITPNFLRRNSARHGYEVRLYSRPFAIDALATSHEEPNLQGDELCMIAKKT